jgi:hypothetical protein
MRGARETVRISEALLELELQPQWPGTFCVLDELPRDVCSCQNVFRNAKDTC